MYSYSPKSVLQCRVNTHSLLQSYTSQFPYRCERSLNNGWSASVRRTISHSFFPAQHGARFLIAGLFCGWTGEEGVVRFSHVICRPEVELAAMRCASMHRGGLSRASRDKIKCDRRTDRRTDRARSRQTNSTSVRSNNCGYCTHPAIARLQASLFNVMAAVSQRAIPLFLNNTRDADIMCVSPTIKL